MGGAVIPWACGLRLENQKEAACWSPGARQCGVPCPREPAVMSVAPLASVSCRLSGLLPWAVRGRGACEVEQGAQDWEGSHEVRGVSVPGQAGVISVNTTKQDRGRWTPPASQAEASLVRRSPAGQDWQPLCPLCSPVARVQP